MNNITHLLLFIYYICWWNFFVDSLYREYLPSVVAAAAIGTARQMLKITPVWSPALQLISNLSYQDVSPCMLNIAEYVF